MELKVFNIEGKEIESITAPKNLLVDAPHQQSMFDNVLGEAAARRQGTHSTLTKGEVRGGGKKPYAQKHTGNARQGSIRNPHFVGGGVAFGPKPTRNYNLKQNKRAARLALCSAFSVKAKEQTIIVLEDGVKLTKAKTKSFIAFTKAIKAINKKVLLIANEKENNLYLSARNINRVTSKFANQASVKDWLHADYVVIQKAALTQMAKGVN
ncbi:MAG: 50S ribosomal protein L4 [Mycoplasmataceae bacterium]|nr:50S ribosomal protein L4 [Mycoplasmataceae bacterium]